MHSKINNERTEISAVVGRELRLRDILNTQDVGPLLKVLTSGIVQAAAVTDEKGSVLWAKSSPPDTEAIHLSILEDIRQGKTSGPCWKVSSLQHEGEVIGFILLYFHDATNEHFLSPLLGTVSACLSALILNNAKRIMTTEVHSALVDSSFEELLESNRRLSASEQRYRELSEALQSMVDEKTAELKKTFSRMLKQEKLSSIGQLAAGMAHEINNPVGFISSNLNTFAKYMHNLRDMLMFYRGAQGAASSESEPLYSKLKIDFILKDSIDLIQQSSHGVHRIKEIVSNLKDFSHIDDARHISVDLSAELDKALNVLSHKISERSVKVIRSYGSVPQIEGDPADISLAFLNILVNALDSRDRGLVISVTTAISGPGVFVTISDNGCGIPAVIQDRIFEPFFSTHETGKGMGMGLTVAYDIVSSLGGDIEVRSEDGKGTAFVITFPITKP
jgi:signal transduction histidine kinase